MRRFDPTVILGPLPIIGVVLLWAALATWGSTPRALLPSPLDVLLRSLTLLSQPEFLGHIATTLFRLVSGFLIALIIGLGLALLSISSALSRTMINAVVQLLAPIPKIALYPAFILLLGFGHSSKIALVAADAALPIYLAAYQGMRNVDMKLVWAARSAGASTLHCLLFVLFPAALPSILTGCRIAMIISCIVVFLSEMISSTEGLGYYLIDAARNFRTIDMFVPIILISALGLSLSVGFSSLRRRLLVGYPEG